MGVGDLAAMTLELTRAGVGPHARHGKGDERQRDQHYDDDGDDDSGGHGQLSSRFATGRTRPGSRETVDR